MSISPKCDMKCMVCYEDTGYTTPCCKQPFCRSCATNWAEHKHTPTCPSCRELYFKSLKELVGHDIKLTIQKGQNMVVLEGQLESLCPTLMKLKGTETVYRGGLRKWMETKHKTILKPEKTHHIKYKSIIHYRPLYAPGAFTCGLLESSWIDWMKQPKWIDTLELTEDLHNPDRTFYRPVSVLKPPYTGNSAHLLPIYGVALEVTRAEAHAASDAAQTMLDTASEAVEFHSNISSFIHERWMYDGVGL